MQLLAEYYDMPVADINYLHIAERRQFIRAKFAVQESKFHDFVFNQVPE